MPDPLRAAAARNRAAADVAEFTEMLLTVLEIPEVRQQVWAALRRIDSDQPRRQPAQVVATVGEARNLKRARLRGGRRG